MGNFNLSSDPIIAGVNLANNVMGSIFQERANRKQFQQQKELMDKSNSIWQQQNDIAYQQARAQMYEAPKAEARGLRSAGLSPIWSQASSPISSVGASSPPSGSSNPQSIWNNIDPIALAQVGLINEQKRGQQIENDRKEQEDNWYNKFFQEMHDNIDDFVSVADDIAGDDVTWKKELQEVEKTARKNVAKKNKGWFDAYNSLDEFNALSQERKERVVTSQFRQAIAEMQSSNPAIVNAIAKMPEQEYKNLIEVTKETTQRIAESKKRGEKYDAEAEMIRFEKDLKEKTNLMPYVDKLLNKDFDTKDMFRLFVLGLVKAFSK